MKIILFLFAIYFIRRFIQVYRVLNAQKKQMQEMADLAAKAQRAAAEQAQKKPAPTGKIVEADFKVIR